MNSEPTLSEGNSLVKNYLNVKRYLESCETLEQKIAYVAPFLGAIGGAVGGLYLDYKIATNDADPFTPLNVITYVGSVPAGIAVGFMTGTLLTSAIMSSCPR